MTRKPLTDAVKLSPAEQSFMSQSSDSSKSKGEEVAPEAIDDSSPTSALEQLLAEPEKEPTVRLTVDMPRSLHTKLSVLCAKTGRKKAEVVRFLLNEALEDVST